MHVYHDESYPIVGHDPFTGHGVLYIATDLRAALFDELLDARKGYRHEVTFKGISGGPKGPRFEVAQRWIDIVLGQLGSRMAFKAYFADHEARFYRAPYKGQPGWERHLMYSTALPLLGVPVFAFREFDHLDVTPVFDPTGNSLDRQAYERATVLAVRRAARRRQTHPRHNPTLAMQPISWVDSDPRKYDADDGSFSDTEKRIDSEWIQVVDVLLGSFKSALVGTPVGKNGRLVLADSVTNLLAETWKLPWYRVAQRARSMTVTIWPDAYGLPYNPRPQRRWDDQRSRLLWDLDVDAPLRR
ncbi:MAG: hypothetical protein IT299_02455 [Dehalococcoidia bacterium]|nr:hypothetical protein [Dehalococcoidia bacterium]